MFKVPEAKRLRHGLMGSDESYGNNGQFFLPKQGKLKVNIMCQASDGEEWKPIKGFQNLYEVSNLGKVRSLPKDIKIPNGAIRHHDLTILKGEKIENDYPKVTLWDGEGNQRKTLVHKLVAEAFIANPNGFPEVNHINGIKDQCSVMNIEWCSSEYNSFHAIENGLKAGFKAAHIEKIKEMLESGLSTKEVAAIVGRSRQTIADIKFGRHRNLNPEEPSRYEGIPLWEHVSTSTPNRCLTWDELCYVKSLFWDAEDTVVQFHPKQSEYVNCHPYCLHLWRPIGREIELPPSILVGFKK